MNGADITIIIVLFLLFDITFYLVVVKGMMVQSIIGKEDPLRRRRDRNAPHFAIQLLYCPAVAHKAAMVGTAVGSGFEQSRDPREVLQQELTKLTLERIEFTPPNELMVGIPEKLRATLQQDFSDSVMEHINKTNLPKVRTLAIGTYVTPTLISEGLQITPVGRSERNIKDTHSEWEWEVVPLKSGKRVMGLDIEVRIQIPGGEERKRFTWPGGEVHIHPNGYFSTIRFIKRWWFVMAIAGSFIAFIIALALGFMA